MKNYFLLLTVCFLCAGCPKKEDVAIREAKGGKNYGGRFRINEIRGNPEALDPALMNSKVSDDIGTDIYDHLVDMDEHLSIVPEVAERWEVSADGKTYTFHLRHDVKFQDNPCFENGKGRSFTAGDVKYSFERICNPKNLTVGFWAFQDIVEGANEYFESKTSGGVVNEVKGFTVANDSTFVVRLTRPYAPFLAHLATSFGFLIPHEAVERYGKDFFQHPVGTGPFTFERWTPDQEIILKRNPNYWGFDAAGNRLPLLDEIQFRFIKDDKTVFAEFERGNFEECFTIPTELFENVFDEHKNVKPPYDKFIAQHTPAMNSYFVNFQCAKGIFANVHIRRAFSYAIDRERIDRYLLKNAPYAPGSHGIVPPAFERYPVRSVSGYGFDAAKAQALLAEAGFPRGEKFPVVELSVYNEPRPMQIAEAIQGMLKEVLGVEVKINVLQRAQLLQAAEMGQLPMWLTRWYADYPDPENFLNLWYGALVPKTFDHPSYPNDCRFMNAGFDQAFTRAVAITDESARMKAYAEAESIAMHEAPAIILFYEEHHRLVQPYVRAYPLDAMNRIDLKYAWFAK